MLFCMLTHTMSHIGALRFNPQKLIDALVLMNGDNVYNFMSKALEVEKSICISHMNQSLNALISRLITEISKSYEHHQAISEIKSALSSTLGSLLSTFSTPSMMLLPSNIC